MISQEYVRKKTLEALEAANGSRREAALLLRVWSEGDPELKSALVAPLMSNLCALAVQRSMAGLVPKVRARQRKAAESDAQNLLGAIGSRGAPTMTSSKGASVPPPLASSVRHRHAVAMLVLISDVSATPAEIISGVASSGTITCPARSSPASMSWERLRKRWKDESAEPELRLLPGVEARAKAIEMMSRIRF